MLLQDLIIHGDNKSDMFQTSATKQRQNVISFKDLDLGVGEDFKF